jgi:hypothetical protein
VSTYTYGTTNNQLVDISPSGNMCAGTWNRNTGGGIGNYTICNKPNPMPSSSGLPYATAFVTASADSVTSNPVEVFIHAQVTSISLVGPQQCLSQTQSAPLDAQACFSGSNNQQQLLCAPSSVTSANAVCPFPAGVSSVPNCSSAIGTLSYQLGTASVGSINQDTNQITAGLPGTTVITASVAGGSSSAGYFSTCPPESINVTLANGTTKGTITQGVQQNLTTSIIDTRGNSITGLSLDYQTTDPVDIGVGSSGGVSANFPGVASVYAICQPTSCNPAPINVTGLYGTGLSITSNPVNITTPGTASDYMWFSSPGQSQYFVPVELLTGTVGSTVRLPYVPNSMVMDRNGSNLFFGSQHELMYYSTSSNTLTKQDPGAPGVVLAVAPNDATLLINDQVRQLFYLYSISSSSYTTFGGMGNAAVWTPDSKTLYITDSASLGAGHSDTLYVFNVNTGWTTYPLSSTGAKHLALTVPAVGAYLSGSPTVAHTWCPKGTVGNTASMIFYPEGDSVNAQTDVLASTTDGKHILGAAMIGGGITLTDIGVTIPNSECSVTSTGVAPNQVETLAPLTIQHTPPGELSLTKVNATAVNQVVASPASNLAFITYTGSTGGAQLPYYIPGSGGAAGTVNYVTLKGSGAITAPVAGAFTPDDSLFFVSTAGDNLIHYISVPTLTDTEQIAPNLPPCTPVSAGGNDQGCAYSGSGSTVPATAIAVKPRSTT